MVHRRESENAMKDKTIVGDEGYRVWKGNTKADAMQLVTYFRPIQLSLNLGWNNW